MVLSPSRYQRYGLLLLALLPLLVVAVLPVSLMWFLLLAPCLTLYYWQWHSYLQHLQRDVAFSINQLGELHWFAPQLRHCQLTGGLVSQHAILLRWQAMDTQHKGQRWIFADQCDDRSFRALARAINQHQWQASAAKLK